MWEMLFPAYRVYLPHLDKTRLQFSAAFGGATFNLDPVLKGTLDDSHSELEHIQLGINNMCCVTGLQN